MIIKTSSTQQSFVYSYVMGKNSCSAGVCSLMYKAAEKAEMIKRLNDLYCTLTGLPLRQRPGRSEARCRKRRPKAYQLLTKPRHEMEEIAHRNRYVATLKLAPFYSDPNIFLEWFYRSHQYERSQDMAPFILILGLRDSPLKINMVRFGPRIKHIDLKSTYQTKHNNANSATQHGPTRLRPIAVGPIADCRCDCRSKQEHLRN